MEYAVMGPADLIAMIIWGLIITGGLLAAKNAKERKAREATVQRNTQPSCGVHPGWWVFWTVAFWPALIVVAVVHSDKKKKATKEIEGN